MLIIMLLLYYFLYGCMLDFWSSKEVMMQQLELQGNVRLLLRLGVVPVKSFLDS